MIPEFQPGKSDVDVCAIASVFVHVTVVPAATVSSSGTNALLPRDSAPVGIDTDEEDAEPLGVGDGPRESGELLPQASIQISNADRRTRRSDDMCTSHKS
jgi:hypothetical protein